MARPKTYIIKLSDDERAALQKTIRNKKTCKTVLKRCQILLELDEEQGTGLTHSQIARSYAVCLHFCLRSPFQLTYLAITYHVPLLSFLNTGIIHPPFLLRRAFHRNTGGLPVLK